MYLVEFIVDKIPGVDSIWDIVHTFIRVPAGALMALGATGDQGLALEMVGGLAGGAMALNSHAVKMGSRAAINTSPEPFSNWAASITEDISVVGGLWLALSHPWLFLGLLVLFVGFSIFLLRMIWSTLKPMIRKVRSWWDRRGDADGEGNGAVRVGGGPSQESGGGRMTGSALCSRPPAGHRARRGTPERPPDRGPGGVDPGGRLIHVNGNARPIIRSRAGTCYAKLDGVGVAAPAGGELDGESHAAAVRSSAALEAGRGAGGRKPAVHLVDSRPSGCLAGRSPGARPGRMPGRAAPGPRQPQRPHDAASPRSPPASWMASPIASCAPASPAEDDGGCSSSLRLRITSHPSTGG